MSEERLMLMAFCHALDEIMENDPDATDDDRNPLVCSKDYSGEYNYRAIALYWIDGKKYIVRLYSRLEELTVEVRIASGCEASYKLLMSDPNSVELAKSIIYEAVGWRQSTSECSGQFVTS